METNQIFSKARLTVKDVREALTAYYKQSKSRKKSVARASECEIEILDFIHVYLYTLETFCEQRATSWQSVPYNPGTTNSLLQFLYSKKATRTIYPIPRTQHRQHHGILASRTEPSKTISPKCPYQTAASCDNALHVTRQASDSVPTALDEER